MGLHNEPGVRILDPIPPAEESIREMLGLVFEDSAERGFVKFSKGDKVVLFVNNLGGMSVLEMGAITSLAVKELGS